MKRPRTPGENSRLRSLKDNLDRALAEARSLRVEIAATNERLDRETTERLVGKQIANDRPPRTRSRNSK